MVMEPPRRELTHLLELGMSKGELVPTLNVDLCLTLLLGPIVYWSIFLRKADDDRRQISEDVVDAFWRAFQAPETDAVGNEHELRA
jgi:hypothetical protein